MAVGVFPSSAADLGVGGFANLAAGLKAVGDAARGALAPLTPLGAALADVGKAAAAVTGGLAGVAGAVTGVAAGLGSAISGMVGKANPGAVMLFSRALDDLQAVMGSALVPVLGVFTDILRMAADTLATFAGTVGGALASALRGLMPLFEILFDVVGRVGQVFGDLLTALAPVLVVFANAVARVVRWVVDGVSELLALVGIDLGTKAPVKGATVGAAVTQAGVGGQDDFLRKAMVSAFGIGAGGDPAKLTADATKSIADKAAAIEAFIKALPERIWEYMKQLPKMFADAIRAIGSAVGEAGYAAGDAVTRRDDGGRNWAGRRLKDFRETVTEMTDFANRLNPFD